MDHPIKRDHSRFNKIIKGKIREGLGRYISGREVIVSKGNGKFKIPMPQIDIPRFKFGDKSQGGVGQGDGEGGSPFMVRNMERKRGEKRRGRPRGKKEREVELTEIELAKILGEKLELPNIEPKGKKALKSQTNRYTSIRNIGPDSLRHFKRTYKNALRREIIAGTYNPDDPIIIPIRGDYRYRSAKQKVEYENAAVVIYMMDVSGSMGDEQKEIVRTESFWINLWLKSQYKDIEHSLCHSRCHRQGGG